MCLDQVWGKNKEREKEKEITKSKKENNNNNNNNKTNSNKQKGKEPLRLWQPLATRWTLNSVMKKRATLYDWPKISRNFINQTTRYIKLPVLTYWKVFPALCFDNWRFATSYDWSAGLPTFVEISPFARFQPFNLPDIALLKKICRHENEIICQIFIILIDIEFITERRKTIS